MNTVFFLCAAVSKGFELWQELNLQERQFFFFAQLRSEQGLTLNYVSLSLFFFNPWTCLSTALEYTLELRQGAMRSCVSTRLSFPIRRGTSSLSH